MSSATNNLAAAVLPAQDFQPRNGETKMTRQEFQDGRIGLAVIGRGCDTNNTGDRRCR